MFKLNPDPTFTAPVSIFVPGKKEPASVDFTFNYFDADQVAALLEQNKDKTVLEQLAAIVAGWNIEGAPFSVENLSLLTKKYPGVDMPIFRAYFNELGQARLGNSMPSPG